MKDVEAECRTHIKCEQQMKLHIECLQEKLDNVQKELDSLKEQNVAHEKLKISLEEQVTTLKDQKEKQEKELENKAEKIVKLEQARDSALNEMKAETSKDYLRKLVAKRPR